MIIHRYKETPKNTKQNKNNNNGDNNKKRKRNVSSAILTHPMCAQRTHKKTGIYDTRAR